MGLVFFFDPAPAFAARGRLKAVRFGCAAALFAMLPGFSFRPGPPPVPGRMGREKSAARRRANRRRGVAAQFAPRPFTLFLSSPCSFAFRAPFSLPFAVFLLFYCRSFLVLSSFLFLPILPVISFSFFFLSFFSFRAPTRPTPRNKIPAGGASPARMAESRQVALRRPNLAIPRFGYIFPLCAGFAALRRRRLRMNPMIGALPRARGASGRNWVGAGPGSGSSRWGKAPRPADGGGFEPHPGSTRRMAPLFSPAAPSSRASPGGARFLRPLFRHARFSALARVGLMSGRGGFSPPFCLACACRLFCWMIGEDWRPGRGPILASSCGGRFVVVFCVFFVFLFLLSFSFRLAFFFIVCARGGLQARGPKAGALPPAQSRRGQGPLGERTWR